jgi:hypothetical protein
MAVGSGSALDSGSDSGFDSEVDFDSAAPPVPAASHSPLAPAHVPVYQPPAVRTVPQVDTQRHGPLPFRSADRFELESHVRCVAHVGIRGIVGCCFCVLCDQR